MSSSTVYFISGANRGLGFAFVAHILSIHQNAFVYAGVRNPETPSALVELGKKHADRLSIVKYVSADIEGNKALAKKIEERHGRVDTVIANAGIANSYGAVSEVSLSELENHFNVNVFGTIILFQSVYSLLKKSSTPRFVPISTIGGCLDGPMIRSTLCVCYGASKAALNWATRKIHFENEWIISFPVSPGIVDTDMLTENFENDKTGELKRWASEQAIPSAEQVATMLTKIIDESTREKDGGEFMHVDGTKLLW